MSEPLPETSTPDAEEAPSESPRRFNCMNAFMDLDAVEAGDPAEIARMERNMAHLARLLNWSPPSDDS